MSSVLSPSYVHRGGVTPLIGTTIDTFVRSVAARYPDREAVVSLCQKERLTYGELMQQVELVARGLLALGVGRGDRVGVWSTDNVEWLLLQLAAARAGAVLVNVNPAYRIAELEHALRAARVQTLFVIPSFRSSHYVEMLRELCADGMNRDPRDFACSAMPELRQLVVWNPDDPAATRRPAPAFHTWPEFVELAKKVSLEVSEERASSLDCDDVINVQFTSGTTGFPKPVMLTHHNILNNAFFVGEAMGMSEKDRLCVPVPFYHCFGMVVSNLGCLTHGATIVIPAPHFDPGATLRAIQDERCTAVHGVPTMFLAELECPGFDRFDLSTLRTGIMAGAPCPAELMQRVMEEMGCAELLIGYGQTEASPVTHATRPSDSMERRTETVGTNLPHQEVKVVDPNTGAIVPIGERGEICFRGYHVMRGYFEDEQATRAAIDEAGWLRSGDVGVLDAEGYLRITGRIKNMIIRGGENVYPAEIEAVFYAHPSVAEIAVFGVSDREMGECVGAWVRPNPGAEIDPEELRTWAVERMAHYKVPEHVWVVQSFPKTVTGKIQKFRIRETAEQWLRGASGPTRGRAKK